MDCIFNTGLNLQTPNENQIFKNAQIYVYVNFEKNPLYTHVCS